MSKELAELLDLELAWKRVKLDIPHHVFIKNPFEVQLLEADLTGYLDDLSARIRNDEYHPKPTYICNVPKGDGLVRPGSILVELYNESQAIAIRSIEKELFTIFRRFRC